MGERARKHATRAAAAGERFRAIVHLLSIRSFFLINDEDQVDDDIQEWLAEDHQHDESDTNQATEELRT